MTDRRIMRLHAAAYDAARADLLHDGSRISLDVYRDRGQVEMTVRVPDGQALWVELNVEQLDEFIRALGVARADLKKGPPK
jgi:hypothetical protein